MTPDVALAALLLSAYLGFAVYGIVYDTRYKP